MLNIPKVLAGIIVCTAVSHAQSVSLPPVRALGKQIAVTHDTLGRISSLRQLSDGRVLVNDAPRRRVIEFDSTLSHARVVLDTTASTNKAFGGMSGGLSNYRGDSSLFMDAAAFAYVVLDPVGKPVRTIAAPSAAAIVGFGPMLGRAIDPEGRVVFRAMPGAAVSPTGGILFRGLPRLDSTRTQDTTYIVRVDLADRKTDTLGGISQDLVPPSRTRTDSLGQYPVAVILPIRLVDDWAFLPDGAVVLIRAKDYHLDVIDANGTRHASKPVPHDWHRLSDSEKIHIVDSTRQSAAAHPGQMSSFNGSEKSVVRSVVAEVVDPEQLPDYRAPFIVGAVVDAEGRIWVHAAAGETLADAGQFDIIDRDGNLLDRVLLPGGTSIVGFGPGVVYLSAKVGKGTQLAKYRIR